MDIKAIKADTIFDGGDLDCGSGLIILIREHMLKTPVDGILEMRSREPTVADDLPPWCRMSGHDYLGKLEGSGFMRYFIKRGSGNSQAEQEALAKDKQEAKEYSWRLRARATGHQKSTIYCRNFSFDVGQTASFEEKDANPCAIEYLLGALAGSLTSSFATQCARENFEVDDIEISLSSTLNNVLVHMGLDEGDPSIEKIELKCFASTFEDEESVTSVWQDVVSRSPLVATLNKAVDLEIKFVIV